MTHKTMLLVSSAVGALLLLVLLGKACDRGASSGLKGQSNTTFTFYASVVDQDGNPLPGARFEYRVEAYPKDWTFDTRGRDNDAWRVAAVSDDRGRFQFEVTACKLIRMRAELAGYRHFCDEEIDNRAINNRFYGVIHWSDLCYKTDPEHPAVYVFLKDGAKTISVLPCRGGYDSGNGTHWTMNKPGWPEKPSVRDVMQKQPSTAQTNGGGSAGP